MQSSKENLHKTIDTTEIRHKRGAATIGTVTI
jgi:hypothetical protein